MSAEERMALQEEICAEDRLGPVEAGQEDRYAKLEQEFAKMFEGVTEIPNYTPFDCYEAAGAMQKLLDEMKNQAESNRSILVTALAK